MSNAREEFALLGDLIRDEIFSLTQKNLVGILNTLQDARTHEELLLIAPEKVTEKLEDFQKRVNAAARKLTALLHSDKIQALILSQEEAKEEDKKQIELIKAVRAAIQVAKDRLSSEDNRRVDKCLTTNDGIMYELFSLELVKPYYPIGKDKPVAPLQNVFEAVEYNQALKWKLEKDFQDKQQKQKEEVKRREEELAKQDQEKLQEMKNLLDCDVLLLIQKRIDALSQKLDQEKRNIEECEEEFEEISRDLLAEDKGMQVRGVSLYTTDAKNEFNQVKDKFFDLLGEAKDVHEALRKKINPLLDQHRVQQAALKAQAEILQEDVSLQPALIKKSKFPWLAAIKNNPKTFLLIVGIGLLIGAGIVLASVFFPPAFLLSVPFITTVILVSAAAIIAAVVTTALLAAAIAGVKGIVDFFKKKPVVEELNPSSELSPPISVTKVELEEESDETKHFRANPGTPGGLHTVGWGADGLRRRQVQTQAPEDVPVSKAAPRPGFIDVD